MAGIELDCRAILPGLWLPSAEKCNSDKTRYNENLETRDGGCSACKSALGGVPALSAMYLDEFEVLVPDRSLKLCRSPEQSPQPARIARPSRLKTNTLSLLGFKGPNAPFCSR